MRGIRWRFAGALVLLVVLTVAGLGVGTHAFVDARLRQALVDETARQARFALAVLVPERLPEGAGRAAFEASGLGWAYGDKPTFVLTSRRLEKVRDSVEFYAGDLSVLVNERLKPAFRSIWFVGGGRVCGDCLRLGLADDVRYSIMPVVIGEGIPFFEGLDRDALLHLAEVKAYATGMVALRYEVRR